MHSDDRTQEYSFLSQRKEDYYVSMRLLRWHLFAFFHKQNGFIKKQKNTCIKLFCLLPKWTQQHPFTTRAGQAPAALLRLPLAHGSAQSTLSQQESLSALNAPCSFSPSLPWASAQNRSSPTSGLPLSLSERLFLCRVLPNAAKLLPSRQQKCWRLWPPWGWYGRVLVPSFALGGLGGACTLLEVPNVFFLCHKTRWFVFLL